LALELVILSIASDLSGPFSDQARRLGGGKEILRLKRS
jgi:hypothetical protein